MPPTILTPAEIARWFAWARELIADDTDNRGN